MFIRQGLKGWVVLLMVFTMALTARAQLTVGLESPRDTFLLYEPIEFTIRVQNLTGSPVALQDHPVSKRPWLSFQIFGNSGEKVGSTGSYSMPPEVLKPGETKSHKVNVTPMYKIRDTGQYRVRATVTIPSRKSFITDSIRINVGKGEVFWSKDVMVDDVKRTYSLIRFLEKTDSSLYLRVEEVDKNLVYSTIRLGSVVGFTKPDVKFDSDGKVHLLHVSTSNLYRYSRLTPDGALEFQEDRRDTGVTPGLVQMNDGGIHLAGGYNPREQPRRKKLSEDQMGL